MQRLSLALLVAFLSTVPRAGVACECLIVGDDQNRPELLVRSDLATAPAIFLGTVTSIVGVSDPPGFPEVRTLTLQRRVTFAVEEAWKGVHRRTITVITRTGAGDCGFLFEVGTRYLVVTTDAHVYPQKEPQASICSNTAEVESSQPYLAAIRRIALPLRLRTSR